MNALSCSDPERDERASARGVLGGRRSSVRLGDGANDRETEARARGIALVSVGARERFERAREERRWEAWSRIADGHGHT